MPHHYDLNQPRVAAGHRDGGQWTSAGYSGHPTSEPYPEKNESKAKSGDLQFEETPGELISRPALLSGFVQPDPKNTADQVWDLFDRLSARNTKDRRAALIFRAAKYLRSVINGVSFENVNLLDQKQVRKYCERLKDVQEYTDEAVNKNKWKFSKGQAHEFGTAVHKSVADKVRAEEDADFTAEQALLQIGGTGSVRYDILEYRPDRRTVCIYDIKTGNAVLGWRRMEIFARAALEYIKGARRVIVIQVRPGQW